MKQQILLLTAAALTLGSQLPGQPADSATKSPAVSIPGLDRIGKVRSASPLAKYLPLVVADEFNPDVTQGAPWNPRRGGKLRVRTPADYGTLTNILITGQPTREVVNHLSDGLVGRDRQTLEDYPEIAWAWREGDLVKRKDGPIQIGRIVSRDDEKVVFAPGAWRFTTSKYDAPKVDKAAGTVTLREERGEKVLRGAVTVLDHTVVVDEGQDPQRETVTIPLAELDTYDQMVGTEVRKTPFVKQSCEWEFLIREGVTWHDGKPFTGHDVKFGYDTIMNPHVEAQHLRPYMEKVESCAVSEDAMTVRYRIRSPYFQILDTIGGILGESYALPRHVFQPEQFGGDQKGFAEAFGKHPFGENPVYTGPYKFASYKPKDSLRIVRNPEYWKNKLPEGAVPLWNHQRPYMDEITWVYYGEAGAVVKDLVNGTVDVDVDVEPTTWNQPDTNSSVFTNKNVRVEALAFLYTYVGWNLEKPVFHDKETRRALAMLIPRDEIGQKVHMGAAFPVSGPFFILSPAYDKSIEPVPYDPRGARRLLQRAGWLDRDGDGIIEKEIDGKMVPFKFTYSIHNARDYHQKIADIVKESVEQAGISVSITKYDWTVFSDVARQHNFDALRFAWGSELDPDVFQMYHSSQIANQGDNFVSYHNPRADELMELIREEMDPVKRWEMGRELHRIFAEDQAVCFMFAFKHFLFANRNLRGVKYYPNEYPLDYTEWSWKGE